ncbi:efflux RND transporter periplasmic adaptor subunit [Algivirga pacifica]|uniref:Efflux RND transporter periplasmic adaptor subunit n=1 Tax=Algivirga pacifica TaxID=1162670 RepID=A0ABP9D6D7_9BACT
MKNIANRLIVLAAASATLTACGGEATLEEKKALLEEKRTELIAIRAEIDELETAIAKAGNKEVSDNLKRITTLTIKEGTFAHYVDVPGDVTSNQNIMVAPEISGKLIKTFVNEGDYVTKGQKIAAIDVELIKKQINELETRLSLAETLYEKQERLWKQNIGSEVQYLQAKNNVKSLKANLESLQTQMSKGYVVAPISGTIDEIFPNLGEMAAAGQPLARIVNLNYVEISADVSERYSSAVKRGDKVTVTFPMLNLSEDLKVQRVGKYINPANRTFKIQMQMNNREAQLKPNTMAMVRIQDYVKEQALVVPTNLVQNSSDGSKFLYIVESKEGKQVTQKVTITTGKSYNGNTMITSGISNGVVVVDKGYSEVINGEQVKVVADPTREQLSMNVQ